MPGVWQRGKALDGPVFGPHPREMAENDPPRSPKPTPDPREARLAEALRANLRRRKAPQPVKEGEEG